MPHQMEGKCESGCKCTAQQKQGSDDGNSSFTVLSGNFQVWSVRPILDYVHGNKCQIRINHRRIPDLHTAEESTGVLDEAEENES